MCVKYFLTLSNNVKHCVLTKYSQILIIIKKNAYAAGPVGMYILAVRIGYWNSLHCNDSLILLEFVNGVQFQLLFKHADCHA